MATHELWESRELSRGDNAAGRRVYHVSAIASEVQAITDVRAEAPTTWSNGSQTLVRQTVGVEPTGYQMWRGTVPYGLKEADPATGEKTVDFDTTGGTIHTAYSLATHENNPVAADYKGAINVDDQNNVQGVDITSPVFSLSETIYVSNGDMSAAFKTYLYEQTGTVNNAAYTLQEITFAQGELLFMGARGSRRGTEDWSLTMTYAAQKSATLTIGGFTVTKYGWEYLWVQTAQEKNAAGEKLIPVVKSVHVEQIYRETNFANLEP